MVASVVASDFEPTAKLFVPPASGTVVRPARLTPQEAWPSEGGAGMLDDAATMRWTPYCGPGATPDDWLARWNLDPVLLGVLVVGFAAAWAARGMDRPRRLALAGAADLLLLAFVSPLCALSSALFAARVTHDVLLVALAAPLLARALPVPGPGAARTLPLATLVQAVVIWLWHAPGPYAAALSSDALYWVMQLSLLGGATVFWRAARAAPAPAAVAALAATMVQMGLLGALITFAPQPLYAPHLGATSAWGLSALEDQQLAGLIMWAPAAGLYLAAALLRLARWLGADPRPAPAP